VDAEEELARRNKKQKTPKAVGCRQTRRKKTLMKNQSRGDDDDNLVTMIKDRTVAEGTEGLSAEDEAL
jgi:hypothetical protein